MTPGALNPAGRVEFRKESNDHGVSLPKRKQERQGDRKRNRQNSGPLRNVSTAASGQLVLNFAVMAMSSTKESTYTSAGLA